MKTRTCVIKRDDGQYAKGHPVHEWTPDLQKARVFTTRTNAANAIPRILWAFSHQKVKRDSLRIVGVSVAEVDE